jgi:hypothetical protein
MRPARLLPFLLTALAAGATPAPAQTRDVDRWQITTDSGEYVWDIRLVRLAGDSLIFRQADTLGTMPVGRIRELRLIRKTTVHLGAGETAGAMAALTGADDEVYDFQTLDFPARIRAVQQIFLVHPPGP